MFAGIRWSQVSLLAWLPVLLAACESPGGRVEAPLRWNDVQYIGTHNSYKRPIDPQLLGAMQREIGDVVLGLDYAHRPLGDQLGAGVRLLELDVFHDPDGGRYASPGGLDLIDAPGLWDPAPMQAPGFKVLHLQDLDFRSHCAALADCLTELVRFSQANPGHLPVMISINAKDAPLDDPMAVFPLPFDAEAWRALDAEILAVMGRDLLLVPADLGPAGSLRDVVLARGFPEIDTLRGRFMFVLDEPRDRLDAYLEAVDGGPVMFPAVPEDHPMAAVLVLNEPGEQRARIRAAVRAGFLVRTRADADTREARAGDVRRRDEAFASGAQFISTDYVDADVRFGTGYEVRFEGGALVRCNPLRVTRRCGLQASP